jgi:hypothetical protein
MPLTPAGTNNYYLSGDARRLALSIALIKNGNALQKQPASL